MYPINLNLRGRRALIVGGGSVAARKLRGLLDSEAEVRLVSPQVGPEIAQLAADGKVHWEPRRFEPADVDGALLVFAATDSLPVNLEIVTAARAAHVLVCDASEAERGDFITPAVHRAGSLTVSVDSGGLSPSLTRRMRDELALQFDSRYARAAENLALLRERVQAVVPLAHRAAVMQHLSERDIDDLAGMPRSEIEHEVELAADTVAHVVPSDLHTLVCASRASALAMVQTRLMMSQLAALGIASTVLPITTKGDAVQDRALAAIGGDSLFVKELETALRERRADYAVHSCKDLPSSLPVDLEIVAITPREDPRDAFCSERYARFEDLPSGARVGTSSPRRRAQLGVLRPDLVYDDIRGNVDTRLRKLRDGDYAAIVLASAGLHRLGIEATYTVPFDPAQLVPAVGQGALAIEMRCGDPRNGRVAAALNDPTTNLCVRAERAFLRTLRGGCQAPVGAHATHIAGVLAVTGVIAAPDTGRIVRAHRARELPDLGPAGVTEAEQLGVELARELLTRGGDAILAALESRLEHSQTGPLAGQLVLLARTQDRPSRIAPALRIAGAEVVEAGDSQAAQAALGDRLPHAILFPSSGSVAAITGYLRELRERGARPVVATMGPASSNSAVACGFPPDVIAPTAEVGAFIQTFTRYVLENPS